MTPLLTESGMEKIKQELNNIRTVKLPHAENRVKKHVENGDVEDAKDSIAELNFYIGRIAVLEKMITTAKMI